MASQPNASGELGAMAHPLVDTGEETEGTAVALHSPAPQGRSPSASDAWGARESPLIAASSLSDTCRVPKIRGNRD